MSREPRTVAASTAALALLLGACGGDDGGDASPRGGDLAEAGAALVTDRGCTGCHEDGVIGPSWDGLHGSTVELEDGTTVVADDDYLTRAITDPGAQVAAGYSVDMPENDLTDDEVANVVAYLRTLDTASPTGGADG